MKTFKDFLNENKKSFNFVTVTNNGIVHFLQDGYEVFSFSIAKEIEKIIKFIVKKYGKDVDYWWGNNFELKEYYRFYAESEKINKNIIIFKFHIDLFLDKNSFTNNYIEGEFILDVNKKKIKTFKIKKVR